MSYLIHQENQFILGIQLLLLRLSDSCDITGVSGIDECLMGHLAMFMLFVGTQYSNPSA